MLHRIRVCVAEQGLSHSVSPRTPLDNPESALLYLTGSECGGQTQDNAQLKAYPSDPSAGARTRAVLVGNIDGLLLLQL